MASESGPDTSFATTTLEFDAVREQLARHTSFSAGRVLALDLRPTPLLEEARRRQAATAEALKLPGLRPGFAARRDAHAAGVGRHLSRRSPRPSRRHPGRDRRRERSPGFGQPSAWP